MENQTEKNYTESSETEQLELWLSTPELREDFDDIDERNVLSARVAEEYMEHPLRAAAHDIGRQLHFTLTDFFHRCGEVLHPVHHGR